MNEMIEEVLRAAGHRVTRPRILVWQALQARPTRPVAAYELQSLLAEEGVRLEPASIYRILQTLYELGLVHFVHSANGYIACRQPQRSGCHHHIVCKDCGDTAEFTGDIVHQIEHRIAEQTGFSVNTHILEFSGLCRKCRARDE
jgi:Fe2+ or Zn2+ uptake regulation protein